MNQARLKVLKARDDMIGVSSRTLRHPHPTPKASARQKRTGHERRAEKKNQIQKKKNLLPGNAERGSPAAGERGQRPGQVLGADGRAALAGAFKCRLKWWELCQAPNG